MKNKSTLYRLEEMLGTINDILAETEVNDAETLWHRFALNFKIRLCAFRLGRMHRKFTKEGVSDA